MLYLDCEFNGHQGQLISMAIVSTDGASWYRALPLFSPPAPWVAEHVLPLLRTKPVSLEPIMQAFETGWAAGLRGDDPRSCPFEKLSWEWHDWHRAHMLAVITFWDE